MRQHHIYAFRNPLTKQFFYAGASVDPDARLSAAVNNARLGCPENKDAAMCILLLLLNSSYPEVVILETVPEKEWPNAERRWIRKLLKDGHPLTNKRAGGQGEWRVKTAEEKQRTIGFVVSLAQLEFLNRVADEQDRSVEALICEAIDEYWMNDERGRSQATEGATWDDSAGAC